VLASDLTWVVYQNRIESLNPRLALPWKFFESLACGVPVVVEAGTIRAKLTKELKCGVVLESDDPSEVSRTIVNVAADPGQHRTMGANARNAFADMKLNWEAMSARLIGIYARLTSACCSNA
jgi:glycosyltransferase involved in cell wall biosynthesis